MRHFPKVGVMVKDEFFSTTSATRCRTNDYPEYVDAKKLRAVFHFLMNLAQSSDTTSSVCAVGLRACKLAAPQGVLRFWTTSDDGSHLKQLCAAGAGKNAPTLEQNTFDLRKRSQPYLSPIARALLACDTAMRLSNLDIYDLKDIYLADKANGERVYGWFTARAIRVDRRPVTYLTHEGANHIARPDAESSAILTIIFEAISVFFRSDLHRYTYPFNAGQVNRPHTKICSHARLEPTYPLVDACPVPIAIYDLRGRLTRVNRAFSRAFGWQADEIIGTNQSITPAERHVEVEQYSRALFDNTCVEIAATQRITKGGALLDVRLTALLLHDQDLKPAGRIEFLQDISGRMSREKRSAQERQDSMHANHAERQFLAKMSHELRTPLNAILGFAQLLERDMTLASAHRERVSIIAANGAHLVGLINDILNIALIEDGKETRIDQVVDLVSLLDSINDLMHMRAHDRNLTLQFVRDPRTPRTILIDERKLRQILINLVGNAIQHTDSGGVTVSIEPWRNEITRASGLIFNVEDTGHGIPEAVIERIFEPFEQFGDDRKQEGGAGLGLTISKRYVELLGGDISVDSCVGGGSRFQFTVTASEATGEMANQYTPQLSQHTPPVDIVARLGRDLALQPATWLETAQLAAQQSDYVRLTTLTRAIDSKYTDLRRNLLTLINSFDYAQILRAIAYARAVTDDI